MRREKTRQVRITGFLSFDPDPVFPPLGPAKFNVPITALQDPVSGTTTLMCISTWEPTRTSIPSTVTARRPLTCGGPKRHSPSVILHRMESIHRVLATETQKM